jgi:cobalamin 5'-phosphate synthase/cobalamin synthase
MFSVIAAFAFLTRLPVWGGRAFGPKEVATSERWFPLVGLVLGAIYAGALWVFGRVFPATICAILLVGLDAWLTGAMHYDGIADSADGFGGGRTREDVLRIMRDHAIGSYGAVALMLTIAIKAAAIAFLAGKPASWPAILLAPVLGRWAAVLLSASQPYARPPEQDGPLSVGSPTRLVGRAEVAIATVAALVVAGVLGIRLGGPASASVAALTVVWGAYCRRRIGGVTGDTVGAAIEISECAVFLIYSAGH